jgi:integrase/recombinase XerD
MIKLKKIAHRGESCIFIEGPLKGAYNIVKSFPGTRYTRTHGGFYLPFSTQNLTDLHASISTVTECEIEQSFDEISTKKQNIIPPAYLQQLVIKRYSKHTIDNYMSQFAAFLEYIKPDSIQQISQDIIRQYLVHLSDEKKVGISTQNVAINAIKFYFEKVNREARTVYYIDRPLPEWKLPEVLASEEVVALLSHTKNIKHRCILIVIYSAGLRISEVLNLRLEDIDENEI